MDYNVRYNIDINSSTATKRLGDFQDTAQRTIPSIITNLAKLRKEVGKVNSAFVAMNRFIGAKPKTVKFTLDSNINKQLKNLQAEINSIKGKTIKVNATINETSTGRTGGKVPVVTPRNNTLSQKGRNRAARGFGSGSRGLFGAADVMYAAGFPFPNMIGAAAIGMGTMSIVKSAAEYENIMTTVQSILKVTDDDVATFDQRFEAMSKNIRQVGIDTKFTTTEVAGAAKYLGMAGLNIEDINNSIKSIANLAIIGDAPLDRMADIVTNIQTAYGLKSSKMPQIADILTSVTTSTNTNVLEMGEAMKFAAPMMSMAKVSFNEAAAAIGALANAGLKGTVAGTALRAMMTRLLNPTKKGLAVLEKYNIKLYETDKLTGKIKLRSLTDIFTQLKAKDASVQDLTRIFDKIGGNAANNIFAELMKIPSLVQNSVYSGGIAEDIASKKQDTIQGKWYKVTSQFTETGMNIFEAYNPIIKKGLDDIVVLLQQPGTIQFFRDLAAGLMTLTKALIGVSQWVSENWSWLEPLIVGGFLSKKVYSISSAFLDFGSTLTGALRGTKALTTAVGVASGSGAAVGGGLLAAIGGIPAVIAAAVAALATFGIEVYSAKSKTANVSSSIKNQIDELLPGFKYEYEGHSNKKKQNYFESLGYDLGFFNGFGNNYYKQYHDKVKEQGELSAAQDFNKFKQDIVSISNIDNNTAIEIIKAKRSQIKSMLINDSRYSIFAHTGEKIFSYDKHKNFTGLNPDDINENNIKEISSFADGYNQSLERYSSLTNKILDVSEKVYKSIPLTSQDSYDLIKLETGKDFKSFNILNEDAQSAYVQNIYSQLRNKKYSPVLLDALFKSLPDHIKNLVPPTELFGPDKARIEGDSSVDTSVSGRQGNGSLSGVGKGSNNQAKHLIINIQSLIGSININSTNGEDMEELRDKVTQVIMDAVKDFEISYS